MNLKELAIKHDYYASDSNYFSREASEEYGTWEQFFNEYHDADIDMNLVYRWDIEQGLNGKYSMHLFMIKQRKGIYSPIKIYLIEEKDVESIVNFLEPHFQKLQKLWNPLTKIFAKK